MKSGHEASDSHQLPLLTVCKHIGRLAEGRFTNSMEHSLYEKPIFTQLTKKFPAFYRIQRFITVFITVRHQSLS